MKTLLLKLAGPLQAYGTASHFETRSTDPHPSKSAVVGMIAAALGYGRDEDEKIRALNDLDFAVRIDRSGRLLKDYHTAKKYKPSGEFDRTYVTNRYYLEDALFLVALAGEDEVMDRIYAALARPYYPLFLGRRALAPTWDFILELTEGDPIERLKTYPAEDGSDVLRIYADAHLIEGTRREMRRDYVRSFSQKNRNFGLRAESFIDIQAPIRETAHDAFSAL